MRSSIFDCAPSNSTTATLRSRLKSTLATPGTAPSACLRAGIASSFKSLIEMTAVFMASQTYRRPGGLQCGALASPGLPFFPKHGTTALMSAEFFALGNAFLFALHNLFTKKALRYSNPATGVISSLLINIVFLWGVSLLFVPLKSLTSASILIFVGVGLFQPGLTRLLTYKGIDTLGVAVTDPIRATTPLFSAMLAIIFLDEKITPPIVAATLMIITGITLLSWRSGAMKLAGSAVFLWYPIAPPVLAGP